MAFDAQAQLQALKRELRLLRDRLPAANSTLTPHLTFPQFKGRGDTRTFGNFIKELNRVGSALGWDEAKLSQILPCLISGDALAVYDVLPDAVKTNWRHLTTELGKRLNNQNDLTSALAKLLQRSQRAGESISEYALAVRDLVRLAYTDNGGFDDTARSKWEILHFRRGLTPRIKLEVGRHPVPDTLDAAISEAIAESDRQKDFQSDLMRNDQLVATAQLQLEHQELRNEMDLLNGQFSDFSVSVTQTPPAFPDHPRTIQHCHRPDSPRPYWCEDRQREHPACPQAQGPADRPPSTSPLDQPYFSQEEEPQEDGRRHANTLFRSGSALDISMPFLVALAVTIAFIGADGQPPVTSSLPTSFHQRVSPSPGTVVAADSLSTTYSRGPAELRNDDQQPFQPSPRRHHPQPISSYSPTVPCHAALSPTQSSTPRFSRFNCTIFNAYDTITTMPTMPLHVAERLVFVLAATTTFVVLVVAAHAFRRQRSPDTHRQSYHLVSQPPSAVDIIRTSSADPNDNQQPNAPPLCSITYSAATSRHRFINVQLHDREVFALVDTGAEASIVRPSLIQHLQLPLDADPTSSNGTTASGEILSFYGTVTTTLSVARHSIQLRLLVATTEAIPAPCIIGLDVLSSLLQPVSFDFTNNFLNIANIPVQLYEMPSTQSAKKFVPSSFGKLLRIPSLIDANYGSTQQYFSSTSTSVESTYPTTTTATTTRLSSTTRSPDADELFTRQLPTSVNANLDATNRPLFIFSAMINGMQAHATFESTIPSCRCRLSFCNIARLPFTKWYSTSTSSSGYVSEFFGCAFGVITIGKVTTDSRALLVNADQDLPTDIVFGSSFVRELYATVSLDLSHLMRSASFFARPSRSHQTPPDIRTTSDTRPLNCSPRRHHRRRPRSSSNDHAQSNKTHSTHRRSSRLHAKRARRHQEPTTSTY